MDDAPVSQINNSEPFFMVGDICFFMLPVTEKEMDAAMKDPETGQPRYIAGYPAIYSPSRRMWPLPMAGIEVIYG